MADKDRLEPRVPTERPDPNAADRNPRPGSKDRPGFDLGGATGETDSVGSNVIPGGPRGSVSGGSEAGGRATGRGPTDGSDGPT